MIVKVTSWVIIMTLNGSPEIPQPYNTWRITSYDHCLLIKQGLELEIQVTKEPFELHCAPSNYTR